MSRRALRNHTPAFKAKVALAAVKGDRTITQRAEQFDVHPDQAGSWSPRSLRTSSPATPPSGKNSSARWCFSSG